MYAACIGNFDGVHLGHRAIMQKTVDLAEDLGLQSVAISIVYPWGYYFPNFPGIIYPVTHRLELILSSGIEKVMTANMSEIRYLEPEDYISNLIKQGVRVVVVGSDFTFGNGAKGNVRLLKKLSEERDFRVDIVPDAMHDNRRISSSWIREALAKGDIALANSLLGKNYAIRGVVYKDKQLGSKIGFPTANIYRGNERLVTPRSGVYIVRSQIDSRDYFGLLNVGFRPTINTSEEVKYEVYFFNYSGNLYDRKLELEVLEFIRPELKFESLDKLIEQIRHDEKVSRRWLEIHSDML
jgi:riboflavin kinase / FMN adenylyltransferase